MDLTNLVSGVTMDVATALKGQQVTVHTNDSHYDLSLEGLISQQFLLHLEHCFNGRDSQALNREVAEFVSYIASFTNFDTTLLCKEFI